ncbi:MAG: MBL fold metallo-hydrolase [Spartobacteria bacterium]|nr:MBL fold metallo-hydrolase [Spartobacteria bacterium]
MITTPIAEKFPQVKLTVLVEDQPHDALIAEHGLSMLVEAAGRCILFDAGQTCVVENNAFLLGVDFKRVDALVLSHGHYDHTGGLPHVLAHMPDVPVYGHPDITRERYSIRDGQARAIAMPSGACDALTQRDAGRFIKADQPVFLNEHIGLTGPIPRATVYEDPGGPFFLDAGGQQPDTIEDDLAMWIQTDKGTIVCVGCAHAGIINTLQHVQRLTKDAKIRALIGGFHLLNASPERLARTLEALAAFDLERIGPCHCTGVDAQHALRATFAEKVIPGHVGRVYTFY